MNRRRRRNQGLEDKEEKAKTAAERHYGAKAFRFGITADPGFKPVEGTEGQFSLGLVFKFNEK